jgi:hypothetical protein
VKRFSPQKSARQKERDDDQIEHQLSAAWPTSRSRRSLSRLGRSKFLQLVDEGRLPKAKKIDGMSIWDRHELDAVFESFAATQVDGGRPNSFDNILGR